VSKLVGDIQTSIFKERLGPDAFVFMSDSTDNKLSMSGFQTDPGFAFSVGGAGLKIGVMHESGILSSYNPRIYSLLSSNWRIKEDEVKADSLSERILNVQKSIISQWGDRNKDGERERDTLIYEAIHEVNKKIFPIWETVLNNTGNGLDWEQMSRMDNGHLEQLNAVIAGSFFRNSGEFFGAMLAMANDYQATFVPDIDTRKYGKFVRNRDLLSNPIDINIEPVSMYYSAGSKKRLPISHAVVRLQGVSSWRDSTKGSGSSIEGIAGVWPETPYAGGGMITDAGPPWAHIGLPQGGKEIPEVGDGRLDLDVLMRKQTDFKKGRVSTVELLDDVCSEWAKDRYIWGALGSSSAHIKLPLNLNLSPGVMHNVNSKNGVFLFRGLLHRVEHGVAGGQSPAAFTLLTYSHIEAGDFRLPNGYS